ncbi:MarR family winged helix-turn-helix transcriptional regulator [Nocardia abscessus]|uniref:MarR family winged helix-turn-helix transcriptional regulator n=1 Tax=Nocardia abscessus TaxID=120957 RepID=UPI002456C12A|nr:MarR family transcriptional regulator [Nocardia abscessus]
MRTAEELRYLILAIQREGNRRLAAEFRPLGVTPSQAEVLRVLSDSGPLTLVGLGELLVCESTTSPSRLVDRMASQGLVQREASSSDRRFVTLTLTPEGRRVAQQIVAVENQLYEELDRLTAGRPVEQALTVLHALADGTPAGEALDRRRRAGAAS